MPAKTLTVDQRYLLTASPERVYRALTEPARLRRWFLAEADIRPEAGTRYTFHWQGGYSHTESVLEAVAPKRLTLGWVNRVGRETRRTRVAFELRKKGRGTLLRVRHTGYPTARRWLPVYGGTEAGWAYFLTNLKSVIRHGPDLRSPLDA